MANDTVARGGVGHKSNQRHGSYCHAPETGQVFAVGRAEARSPTPRSPTPPTCRPPCAGPTCAEAYVGRQRAMLGQSLQRGSKGGRSAAQGHWRDTVGVMIKARKAATEARQLHLQGQWSALQAPPLLTSAGSCTGRPLLPGPILIKQRVEADEPAQGIPHVFYENPGPGLRNHDLVIGGE